MVLSRRKGSSRDTKHHPCVLALILSHRISLFFLSLFFSYNYMQYRDDSDAYIHTERVKIPSRLFCPLDWPCWPYYTTPLHFSAAFVLSPQQRRFNRPMTLPIRPKRVEREQQGRPVQPKTRSVKGCEQQRQQGWFPADTGLVAKACQLDSICDTVVALFLSRLIRTVPSSIFSNPSCTESTPTVPAYIPHSYY